MTRLGGWRRALIVAGLIVLAVVTAVLLRRRSRSGSRELEERRTRRG